MLRAYTFDDIGDYGVIYCLTSPSGKCYIGQTWHIKHRFDDYIKIRGKLKKQIKLYYALQKYGSEKFQYDIIDICQSQEEMDNKEKFYIEIYDSMKSGYNCREGGNNSRISDETKERMSIAQSGKIILFLGKHILMKQKKNYEL